MALIYSVDGTTRRLEPTTFANEADLQAFLFRSPEAIPLEDLGEGTRLHILGREFPTPSGPIDALGTDQNGTAYIVETKLFKNPDKRLVLAQVLDYGAALWAQPPEFEDLLRSLDCDATRREVENVLPRLARFLRSDEALATERLGLDRNNLIEGRFTAVILMDRLEPRLRNLIQFMNQSSQFQILAVELDYYRHDQTEIVVPRIFGGERRSLKQPIVRGKWNEQTFFEDLIQRVTSEQAVAIKSFFAFCKELAPIKWGSGTVSGSFSPLLIRGLNVAPISIFSDGSARLKMSWFGESPQVVPYRRRLLDELAATGLSIDAKGDGLWSPEIWTVHVQAIMKAFDAADGTVLA